MAEKKLVEKSTGAALSRVTLSAGVAQHELSDTVADLLRCADLCLYAAKHAGRNEVVSEIDSKRLKAFCSRRLKKACRTHRGEVRVFGSSST